MKTTDWVVLALALLAAWWLVDKLRKQGAAIEQTITGTPQSAGGQN